MPVYIYTHGVISKLCWTIVDYRDISNVLYTLSQAQFYCSPVDQKVSTKIIVVVLIGCSCELCSPGTIDIYPGIYTTGIREVAHMKVCEKCANVVSSSAVRRMSSAFETASLCPPTSNSLGQNVSHATPDEDRMPQTSQGGENDEPTIITNHSLLFVSMQAPSETLDLGWSFSCAFLISWCGEAYFPRKVRGRRTKFIWHYKTKS